jgi:GNAT superfamily N-acetyltransferase
VAGVIEPIPADAADDRALMSAVTDLVNRVYAESERGLWIGDAARTTFDEVVALVHRVGAGDVADHLHADRAGGLVMATADSRLTGVIRVRPVDGESGEFGMLAVDPAVRGQGFGRELVRYAEDATRAAGCRFMQLELLVPRGWVLESKEFLARWYDRLGYRLQRVARIDESYPELAPLLATAADFRIYRKTL